MRQTYILLTLCLLATVSCKKSNTVDFEWSPKAPCAGKAISFTNNSSSGEDWSWTFGDESSSTSKNPKKTYMKAGTYTVTLQVDGKKGWTCTKTITVVDSIPSFTCSPARIDTTGRAHVYEELTLTASIYNPYNHALEYRWELPSGTMNQTDSLNGKSVKVLFTELYGEESDPRTDMPVSTKTIKLDIRDTKTDSVWHASRTFAVQDTTAEAIVYYESEESQVPVRQRVFGTASQPYYEAVKVSELYADEDRKLLGTAQDTAVLYNGTAYACADWGQDVQGFGIHDRRLYYRSTKGLYVRDLSGSNEQEIYSGEVHFMCIDKQNNRLYWSSGTGLYYMPLIQTSNNIVNKSRIGEVNKKTDIKKIAIDKTPRTISELID